MATARDMHRRKLVAGSTGNVSARWRDGMLITPTRRQYAELRSGEVVWLGPRACPGDFAAASIEWRIHAEIYASHPDVAAVVHTHSAFATVRSFREEAMVVLTEERTYLEIPQVPVSQHQPSGSYALAREVVSTLGTGRVALLARHGGVAVGAALSEALESAEVMERLAQIDWLLRGGRGSNPGARPHPGLVAAGVDG